MDRGKLLAGGAIAAGVALIVGGLWRAWRPPRSFRHRVVVITGGSRGLGLDIARRLADERARVVLLARDEDELERARVELARRTPCVLTIPVDVRERAAVERAIEQVVDAFGRIDALINDAGTITVGPFEHFRWEDLDDALRTHLIGPLAAIRAARPYLARTSGRIVNVTSIAGRVGVPHFAAYSASKGALVALSDALRAELAVDGIAITTVVPWLMRTGGHEHARVLGQHRREYTWFALADTLPGVAVDSDRAARAIIEAMRVGRPRLVLGGWARLIVAADAVFPGMVAFGLKTMARWLPAPAGAVGEVALEGGDIEAPVVHSPLLRGEGGADRRE